MHHCLTCGTNHATNVARCPRCEEALVDLRDPAYLELAEAEDHRRRTRHDRYVMAIAIIVGIAIFPFAWMGFGSLVGTAVVIGVAIGVWFAVSAIWRFRSRLPGDL